MKFPCKMAPITEESGDDSNTPLFLFSLQPLFSQITKPGL